MRTHISPPPSKESPDFDQWNIKLHRLVGAGVGYNPGFGGSATQGTSKSTAVTVSAPSGKITMHNAALGAGAKVSFTVTCGDVDATHVPIVCVSSGGTANAYRASVTKVAAGSFVVTVENITAGSLSEAPIINFAIIKAASA